MFTQVSQQSLVKSEKIAKEEVEDAYYMVVVSREQVVILVKTKDKLQKLMTDIQILADEKVLDIKAKSDAINQRAKEILNLQSKTVSEEEKDALAQEYLKLKDEADILEAASKKVKTEKTEQVDADNVVPDYTSKTNSDQAAKSPYTDEYKLKLTSVLNNWKKQLNQVLGIKFKRILFDNMRPKQLKKCLKICKNKYETEYSGNATLKNIKKISNTGINRISVGAITHGAKSFDVSLELSS